MENTVVGKWFEDLSAEDQRLAQALFGKTSESIVEKTEERPVLSEYIILALESLGAKRNFSVFHNASAGSSVEFGRKFGQSDEIDSSFYRQIFKGRIGGLLTLQNIAERSRLEKVVQKLLFERLWLLDPSRERATTTEHMEKRVYAAIEKATNTFTEEEKRGCAEIKHLPTAGKHVIVELKRASATINTRSLASQVGRYRAALIKLFDRIGKPNKHTDIVCVVGKDLTDWSDPDGRQESDNMLAVIRTRAVTCSALLQGAYEAYRDFLDKSRLVAGRLSALLEGIDNAPPFPRPKKTTPKTPLEAVVPNQTSHSGTHAAPFLHSIRIVDIAQRRTRHQHRTRTWIIAPKS